MYLIHLFLTFSPNRFVPVKIDIGILENHEIRDRLVIISRCRKIITCRLAKIDFGPDFYFAAQFMI